MYKSSALTFWFLFPSACSSSALNASYLMIHNLRDQRHEVVVAGGVAVRIVARSSRPSHPAACAHEGHYVSDIIDIMK